MSKNKHKQTDSNSKTSWKTGGTDQMFEMVVAPCPINRTHYYFEMPVKETKIPSRKHYENVLVVYLNINGDH